jgi:hypothetical protein
MLYDFHGLYWVLFILIVFKSTGFIIRLTYDEGEQHKLVIK